MAVMLVMMVLSVRMFMMMMMMSVMATYIVVIRMLAVILVAESLVVATTTATPTMTGLKKPRNVFRSMIPELRNQPKKRKGVANITSATAAAADITLKN
jgi:hypothetical protein